MNYDCWHHGFRAEHCIIWLRKCAKHFSTKNVVKTALKRNLSTTGKSANDSSLVLDVQVTR